MDREQAIKLLKQHEPEFRQAGVGVLFLFGSVARNEASETSDVDLFFDLERVQGFTLFDLIGLPEHMQMILGTRVNLMTRKGIQPRRRARIEASAVRVFRMLEPARADNLLAFKAKPQSLLYVNL